MKSIILYTCFCIGFGLSGINVLQAQQKNIDRSKELRIGDMVPALNPMEVLNYEKDQVNLNDSKGKVILLDFFDTFCSVCITTMPKLQRLQDKMKDKLQVVTVTWQDKVTIAQFYQGNTFLKQNNVALPTIYADTILRKYFPHQAAPHVAWIYQGKVQAVTHSDFVEETNVDLLLKKGKIRLPRKNDFFEAGRDLIALQGTKMLGAVSLTGFRDGVPAKSFTYQKDSLSGQHKTSFYNMPVFSAYSALWSKIRKPEFMIKGERIVWKVKDSAKYMYMGGSGKSNIWLAEHGICYERTDAIGRTQAEQAKIVVDDLNRFLGLRVYWTKKAMRCLVIGKVRTKERKSPMETKASQNVEGSGVLAFLLDYSGKYPPAVDEVNTKVMLTIGPDNSISALNAQLAPYGIKISEGVRALDVLVVEEAGHN